METAHDADTAVPGMCSSKNIGGRSTSSQRLHLEQEAERSPARRPSER